MKLFGTIECESEKAYKINTIVSWGGTDRNRSFWFPKSLCKACEKGFDVQDWFINKLECENAFKGYFMCFVLIEK